MIGVAGCPTPNLHCSSSHSTPNEKAVLDVKYLPVGTGLEFEIRDQSVKLMSYLFKQHLLKDGFRSTKNDLEAWEHIMPML